MAPPGVVPLLRSVLRGSVRICGAKRTSTSPPPPPLFLRTAPTRRMAPGRTALAARKWGCPRGCLWPLSAGEWSEGLGGGGGPTHEAHAERPGRRMAPARPPRGLSSSQERCLLLLPLLCAERPHLPHGGLGGKPTKLGPGE